MVQRPTAITDWSMANGLLLSVRAINGPFVTERSFWD